MNEGDSSIEKQYGFHKQLYISTMGQNISNQIKSLWEPPFCFSGGWYDFIAVTDLISVTRADYALHAYIAVTLFGKSSFLPSVFCPVHYQHCCRVEFKDGFSFFHPAPCVLFITCYCFTGLLTSLTNSWDLVCVLGLSFRGVQNRFSLGDGLRCINGTHHQISVLRFSNTGTPWG